jgi:Mo25-like
MAFLFNRSNRPKTPQDLVRSVRESISRLDVPTEKKRAIEEITKCLNAMKNILIGDGGRIFFDVGIDKGRSGSCSRASIVTITRDLYV